MTDSHESRAAADHDWLVRYARPLAAVVVIQFVILAALAVGIAVTSSTAQHALTVNERSTEETGALRAQVRDLNSQNDELLVQIDALRRQVESLGGVPVNVTIEDARSSTTTTTAPRSTTTTTAPSTTTTTTCRLPSPVGCLRSSGRAS